MLPVSYKESLRPRTICVYSGGPWGQWERETWTGAQRLTLRAAEAGMGGRGRGAGTQNRQQSPGRGRPGAGTLTCHDSHVAVAVAEGLHQRGHVRQQPQGGPLAEARGHFLPLGYVQVLNFTGQTHQLGGRGVREDSSDPGLLTPTSRSRSCWAAPWGWMPRRCSSGSSEHLMTSKGSLLGPSVFFSLSSIFPCSKLQACPPSCLQGIPRGSRG